MVVVVPPRPAAHDHRMSAWTLGEDNASHGALKGTWMFRWKLGSMVSNWVISYNLLINGVLLGVIAH